MLPNNQLLLYVLVAACFGTLLADGILSLLQKFAPAWLLSVALIIVPLALYRKQKCQPKEVKASDNYKVEFQVKSGLHALEAKYLADSSCEQPFITAVNERRKALGIDENEVDSVDLEEFYKKVYGKCCESVIGALWMPVGVVGPLPLVGGAGSAPRFINVPLATVEGALVASVNRGCKALRLSYESLPSNLDCIISQGHRKGITRGPSFRAVSIAKAAEFLEYLHDGSNFEELKFVFEASSPGGHAKLIEIRGRQIGNYVYVRVRSDTSSAMGMNMISRGCSDLFGHLLGKSQFKGFIALESLSGNYCVDKKPAAINWIEGRGREVIASVRLSSQVLEDVFSIKGEEEIKSFVRMNTSKNLIGSAAGGSVGGFNAHVANVVAAIFLATGQDAAQIVDASQGMTLMEWCEEDESLVASLTMPCVEIGVIGGGTGLPHQRINLEMILGVGGVCDDLARCVALTALAGELSLLAALKNNTLVSSHFRLNH